MPPKSIDKQDSRLQKRSREENVQKKTSSKQGTLEKHNPDAENPVSQTAVQNRNKELESAPPSRLKSVSSAVSQSSSRSSSSSTQNKERDYRRVKRGTPTDEILKLRDPMFSPDDPNQIMREIEKKPTAPIVDPSIVIPRDLSIPPPPQDKSGLTKEVRRKVEEQFPNASVLFNYPFIVVAGAKPPTNPISINNLIVEFYDDMQDFKYAPGKGGNPTIKDPVAKELPYNHSSFPSFDALDAIINVLGNVLGIEICSLAVYLHVLVVEVNEKDYDLHKLPGKVAGRSTLWGIKGNTWGKKRADFPRKKVPTGLVVDDSDYKSEGLSPGVKVRGESKATSSGTLIRNIITSEERITIAEHGWGANESTVFHPNVSQEIGTITDRYPLYDVALCRLNPGLTYTNNKYFSAPPPSHFLNSDDYILKTHPWTWFGVDGFTTGLVWLGAAGIIKHRGRDVAHLTSQNAFILRKALASESELTSAPADGICGAPVVHQEDEDPILDCGCVGFFSEYDGINALVPTIDHFVEKGWEIVKD